MEEYKTSSLIILDNKSLIGTVSEDEILNMSELSSAISSIITQKQKNYLNPNNHFCEALKMIHEKNIDLIPILEKKLFISTFSPIKSLEGLYEKFSSKSTSKNPYR